MNLKVCHASHFMSVDNNSHLFLRVEIILLRLRYFPLLIHFVNAVSVYVCVCVLQVVWQDSGSDRCMLVSLGKI